MEERERLETSKQRAIVYREWSYFAMAGLFCLMMVWALWSWRAANNMVSATQAKFNIILDRFGEKMDNIPIEGLRDLIASGNARVEELGAVERELTGLVGDTRRNSTRLTEAAAVRLDRLQDNLDSLRAVTDQTATSIKQVSDATATLMTRYSMTADEAGAAIRLASEKTGKSLDELAKQIADPRWGKAADSLAASTEEAHKLLVDFHKDVNASMQEMPGIARDIHKTTTNISKYSKITIVTSIISRLASAFIPGLLN